MLPVCSHEDAKFYAISRLGSKITRRNAEYSTQPQLQYLPFSCKMSNCPHFLPTGLGMLNINDSSEGIITLNAATIYQRHYEDRLIIWLAAVRFGNWGVSKF